ncbi:MAG: hypothetical protein ACR2PL_14065 [Dehalococcoidia bacterium]
MLEERGLPTVTISSARSITELVRPPRSVFLNFPIGHQAGKRNDREGQVAIVRDALRRLDEATEPGTIVDLPYEWEEEWESKAATKGV